MDPEQLSCNVRTCVQHAQTLLRLAHRGEGAENPEPVAARLAGILEPLERNFAGVRKFYVGLHPVQPEPIGPISEPSHHETGIVVSRRIVSHIFDFDLLNSDYAARFKDRWAKIRKGQSLPMFDATEVDGRWSEIWEALRTLPEFDAARLCARIEEETALLARLVEDRTIEADRHAELVEALRGGGSNGRKTGGRKGGSGKPSPRHMEIYNRHAALVEKEKRRNVYNLLQDDYPDESVENLRQIVSTVKKWLKREERED